VLASLSWALGSLYTRYRASSHGEPFLKTAALQMVAGGSLLLLISILDGELASPKLNKVSLGSVALMVYLIVAGSLISFTLYGWLLTVVRPTLVSTYAFVSPVVAVLLDWVLDDEALSARELFAGALVVCAVALMVLARPRGS